MNSQHQHQGVLSVIRYAPIPERDEHFAVGLAMLCEDLGWAKVKFSEERIKRLYRAFGAPTSILLESLVESQTKEPPKAQAELSYLSRYENGLVRYDAPKPLVSEDFETTFEQLYHKWIADESEKEAVEKKTKERHNTALLRLMKSNKNLSSRLNIDYRVDGDKLGVPMLLPSQRFDFIGGNGSIYCGKYLSLSSKEDTVAENLIETLHFIEMLGFLFESKFKPSDCKLILDEAEVEQYEKPRNLISFWKSKLGFSVVQIASPESLLEEIEKEVVKKNVSPFEQWIEQAENKPKWQPAPPHAKKELHSR